MKRLCLLCFVLCFFMIPVCAEEEISEIGPVEDFQEWVNAETSTFSTLNFVRRVGRIVGVEKVSFFSLMTIDGQLAYCIEPSIYAATGQEYTIDWGKISEETKQRLFRLTNVGYGNFGHDGDEWFIATQLAIWRAMGIYHLSAQTMDKQPWDVSWQVAEIERMADAFGETASFSGQTLSLDLGVPETVMDHHGILSQFQIESVNGVEIVQNQNELTITIQSMNHEHQISGSKGLTTGGLVFVHPGKQSVYMVHPASAPISYDLKLKLNTGTLIVNKQDEFHQKASKTHGFELRHENGEVFTVNDSSLLQCTDGQMRIEQVPAGTYELKEVQTEYPYVISDELKTVHVETDQITEVSFINELQHVTLIIAKKDRQTLELLEGAVFSVLVDGKEVLRKEAKQGRLELNDFKYGQTIQVCEVKAPRGYQIDKQPCQTITLTPDEKKSAELVFLNDPREIQLRIVKKDSSTKELLDGAQFSISVQEDDVWKEVSSSELIQTFEYGRKVKVCEVKAPEGYQLSSDPCQIIEMVSEEDEIIMTFENDLRSIDLKIIKKDEETLEPLSGVLFSISVLKDEKWEDLFVKHTGETMFQLDESWPNKEVTIYANQEKTISLGTFMISDEGILDVSSLKTSGTIYLEDDEQHSIELYLDNAGELTVPDLAYGDAVQVCEVKPKEGYEMPEHPCTTVQINAKDDVQKLILTNRLRSIEVMLYKVETGHEDHRLNDALFQITKTSTHSRSSEITFGLTGRIMIQTTEPVQIYRDEACTDVLMEVIPDADGEVIAECEEDEVFLKINHEITHLRVAEGGIDVGSLKYGDVLSVCEVSPPTGFVHDQTCRSYEVKSETDQMDILFDNERIVVHEVPPMGLD